MVLKMSKAFTLIELLVVVAIIGILAAVGVNTFNGFQDKAKVSSSKANHKSVTKYIINEVMRCSIGESYAMNGNLDCSKQGTYDWKDNVADAAEKSLTNFKNPYNPSESSVTHGGGMQDDNQVGYNRVMTPGTNVKVLTCTKTPCTGAQCKMPNHSCSQIININ
jgi:type IV pilus assembly protein PilA